MSSSRVSATGPRFSGRLFTLILNPVKKRFSSAGSVYVIIFYVLLRHGVYPLLRRRENAAAAYIVVRKLRVRFFVSFAHIYELPSRDKK